MIITPQVKDNGYDNKIIRWKKTNNQSPQGTKDKEKA